MATLYRYLAYELTVDGETIAGGSHSAASQVTVDGKRAELVKSLATATTWDVWEAGSEEPLSDFDYLFVEADQNVLLELTCDKGNEVGTVVFAKEIPASKPFDLITDDAMAAHTADFGAGTEDVIDRLRIRNVSGSTATVRVLLVT